MDTCGNHVSTEAFLVIMLMGALWAGMLWCAWQAVWASRTMKNTAIKYLLATTVVLLSVDVASGWAASRHQSMPAEAIESATALNALLDIRSELRQIKEILEARRK